LAGGKRVWWTAFLYREHRAAFSGADLPSGVYICRLETDAGVMTRRMVLQK
jgi:hypothetical protein